MEIAGVFKNRIETDSHTKAFGESRSIDLVPD